MQSSVSLRDLPHDPPEVDFGAVAEDRGDQTPPVGGVRRAIGRTRSWLLARQHPDGHWCGELEGDTILESETILLLAFLGQEHSDLAQAAARYLIDRQLPEGGWTLYPGGAMEISGSVKAYFALKLTGHDTSSQYMQRARRAILAHGGADAVNSYTRYFLALLGQIPYEQCPAVPPETVLLPKWLGVNLYAMSAWSRTIMVPLSIVWALAPVRPIESVRGIRELFLRDPADWPELRCPGLPGGTGLLSWDRFFRTVDRGLKFLQRHRLTPLRRKALAAAESWMCARFQRSDGLGAIYPPIVFSIIALKCLGYADDSPEMRYCRKQLDDLVIEDPVQQTVRLQPCKSPVWDTAIALRALAAAGMPADSGPLSRAIGWLLDKEVLRPGDWAQGADAQPGGWYFEYNNEFYPDCDDTAMVLMALATNFAPAAGDRCQAERPGSQPECPDSHPAHPGSHPERPDSHPERPDSHPERPGSHPERSEGSPLPAEDNILPRDSNDTGRITAAVDRALRWMLAMQNDDGGWGAFDRNNNHRFLCYIPFADHNAMIDPSTPDLAARVLEALGRLGHRLGDPAVDRAVAYLRRSQEPDGSWYGRWGVNYIYGCWQTLAGLDAVGLARSDPMMTAAAHWLLAHQQPSGGWGESADSYADPRLRGQGPPTASQTAWALMGLLAAGLARHPAVARGAHYLVDAQRSDGAWDEPEFTGTGFPRVFYLRYHYYPIYFPLMALSQWAALANVEG
jgi:squalene-hopene/tetraprenyl-beta-curcumene cyclase